MASNNPPPRSPNANNNDNNNDPRSNSNSNSTINVAEQILGGFRQSRPQQPAMSDLPIVDGRITNIHPHQETNYADPTGIADHTSNHIRATSTDDPVRGSSTNDVTDDGSQPLYANDYERIIDGVIKNWHEANGFFNLCANCYVNRKRCNHSVPCSACIKEGAFCTYGICVFGNCTRTTCMYVHADYMHMAANAITSEGGNGPLIARRFFEKHRWVCEPSLYRGQPGGDPNQYPSIVVRPNANSLISQASRNLPEFKQRLRNEERENQANPSVDQQGNPTADPSG